MQPIYSKQYFGGFDVVAVTEVGNGSAVKLKIIKKISQITN